MAGCHLGAVWRPDRRGGDLLQGHPGEGGTGNAPAGWYRDPERPGSGRYWDGERWTDQRATAPPPGWYPDPEQPGGRRYWDGEHWTPERIPAAEEEAGSRPTEVLGDERVTAAYGREPAEPPRRSRRRPLALALVVVALAVGAGVGAYFVGRSTGEDLDAARAAGEAAGQREGAAKGAQQGYAEGFKAGRKKGYEQTYDDAYKAAYRKAFENAGLAAPENVSVPQEP